jgi:hypothetical protein
MADPLNTLIGRGLAIARWNRNPTVRNCAREGVRWLNMARAARRDGLAVTSRISLAVALEHFKNARGAASRLEC